MTNTCNTTEVNSEENSEGIESPTVKNSENSSTLLKYIKKGRRSAKKAVYTTLAPIMIIGGGLTAAGLSQSSCMLDRDGRLISFGGSGGEGGATDGGGGATGGSGGAEGGGGATGGSGGSEGGGGGNGGSGGGCVPTGPELCDGIDNDCQNGIDDNPIPEVCPLNTGVCLDAHLSKTCDNAQWSTCQDAYELDPDYDDKELTAAHCDGINNDCINGIDDNGNSATHGCLTVLAVTGLFEFFANPDNTTLNALPESTGDGTCGNTDVTTMTGPGHINVIWRFGGNSEKDIKIKTQFPPVTMETGCSVEAQLNCPTNQQMWDDFKNMVGVEVILPTAVNGDEYTYESTQSCGRHVFVMKH